MQLQITSSGKSRSFRVIEKVCQDGKTSSRVIKELGSEQELKARLGENTDIEEWAADYVSSLNAQQAVEEACRQRSEIFTFNLMDERESMDLLHTGSLIVCHELAKLGLREITAELQARHKCSLNPGKFLAQLVCAVIMNTKTARDFPYTPELVQHRFLRLQGSFPDSLPYDYAEFCRMLAVIGREAEAIQAMLYRLNAEAAGSSTQAELYYSTEYFVFSNPDPDDTLHYGFSAQSGYVRLIMNGQGLPVAFDLAPDTASGKVRKQELQALTERLQQDFNLTVTTLRPRVKAEQAEARSHISRTLRLLKMLLTSQLVFGQEEHQARGMMTVCLLALLVLRKLDDQTAGVLPKKNRTDKTIAALKSLTALPVNEEYCIRSFCRSDITKTLQQSAGLLFLTHIGQ